jgi:hypothetical protein
MKIKLFTLFAILGLTTTNFIGCAGGESQNEVEPTLEADPEEEADAGLDGEESE